jgi:hypothetical protein
MSAAKKAKKSEVSDSPVVVNAKLKGKDYERELARLHAELVKLQQWVGYKEPDYSYKLLPELPWANA